LLSNDDAYDALAASVERNTDHRTEALKDLRQAIEHGNKNPIILADEEEKYQKHVAAHRRPKRQRKPGRQEGQAMMPARNDDTQGETPNIPGEVLGEQDPGDDGTPVPEVLHVHDDLDEDQPLAEQLQDLLERIKATAEDDQLRLIFENMDTMLVQLPTAEWLIFKSKIKTIMKQRVSVGALDKVRDKALTKAKPTSAQPHIGPLFQEDVRGKPKPCLANVIEVLTVDEEWADVLEYDEMKANAMLMQRPPWREPSAEPWKTREVTSEDHSEANNWLQRRYDFTPDTSLVAEAMHTVARRRPYHEIRKYLDDLVWDQVQRLETWLITYCHADDTPYTRAVGRIILISAVARVQQPGCKVDTMPILVGEQGFQKSTVFEKMASPPWFSDTITDIRTKDAMQNLRGIWFIEFAEMTQMKDRDVEAIKAFITSRDDKYRNSYGRVATSHPRQNIFCGTANRDDFLKDETGNRRFLPIKINARCDIEALGRDRDQLWAEAMHCYRAGEQWYLTGPLEQIATVVQNQYLDAGAWEDTVMAFLEEKRFYRVTSDYLLAHAIHMPRHLWSKKHLDEIGKIMRRHGWSKGVIPTEVERWVYQLTAPATPSRRRVKGYYDPQRRFVDPDGVDPDGPETSPTAAYDTDAANGTDVSSPEIGTEIGNTGSSNNQALCTDVPDASDTRVCEEKREEKKEGIVDREEVGGDQESLSFFTTEFQENMSSTETSVLTHENTSLDSHVREKT
jgi:predicted P-loop ATPase